MENSKIEWCDHTFNPWSGCQKISPGCQHCYAEVQAKRNPTTLGVWGPQGTRVRMNRGYWRKPLRWNEQAKAEGRQYRVFCASMADVFENKPELAQWRAELFEVIAFTPHLDWLLLTKRPQNILSFTIEAMKRLILDGKRRSAERWESWLAGVGLRNVWIGTSVEDQAAADERIPHLLNVPARVRFLSCEPLLGPVEIHRYAMGGLTTTRKLDWVICGGESGHGARPMCPTWARSLRDQCQAAGVPYFFKQWGEWAPAKANDETEQIVYNNNRLDMQTLDDGSIVYKFGKKVAGRLLDGRQWDQFPVTE